MHFVHSPIPQDPSFKNHHQSYGTEKQDGDLGKTMHDVCEQRNNFLKRIPCQQK